MLFKVDRWWPAAAGDMMDRGDQAPHPPHNLHGGFSKAKAKLVYYGGKIKFAAVALNN